MTCGCVYVGLFGNRANFGEGGRCQGGGDGGHLVRVFVCEYRQARRLPLKDSFIVVVSFIQAGHRVKDALKGKKRKGGG